MMKLMAACIGVFAFGLLAAGCAAPVEGSDGDEHAGSAAQAQLQDDSQAYTVTQSAETVASAWAGRTADGTPVEYWAASASYAASAGRGITGASQSCAEWKRGVCDGSWRGAAYYRAVHAETKLDCALPPGPCSPGVECSLPPGPCTPSADAVSFLGEGSYEAQDASERSFAWTYVSGRCEYWAMNHAISSGTTRQAASSSSWESLGEFQKAMCAGTTATLIWDAVYYEPISCSDISC